MYSNIHYFNCFTKKVTKCRDIYLPWQPEFLQIDYNTFILLTNTSDRHHIVIWKSSYCHHELFRCCKLPEHPSLAQADDGGLDKSRLNTNDTINITKPVDVMIIYDALGHDGQRL